MDSVKQLFRHDLADDELMDLYLKLRPRDVAANSLTRHTVPEMVGLSQRIVLL